MSPDDEHDRNGARTGLVREGLQRRGGSNPMAPSVASSKLSSVNEQLLNIGKLRSKPPEQIAATASILGGGPEIGKVIASHGQGRQNQGVITV